MDKNPINIKVASLWLTKCSQTGILKAEKMGKNGPGEIEKFTSLAIFGRNLSKIRKARELTQVEFALQLGYESTGTISQFERAIAAPSLKKVFLMAKVLNVPVQVLLSETEWSKDDIKLLTEFCDILKHKNDLAAFNGAKDLIKMMHRSINKPRK
jgi:transcriptional regulator with XRE-family HTH domain